ncbi:MAG: alpha/beta fold hydrolase [Armatimonadetes bacterium]|nr:alpha/beta fold hydrolase [Armatimonadota bacterium]
MLWLLAIAVPVLLLWGLLAWTVTHPLRAPLFLSPYDMDMPYEEVQFPSRDALTLSGWWVAHPEPLGAVVLCHGYMANRCEVAGVAHVFYQAGFSCLLFDFRAMGRSQGYTTSIGWHEVQDALGAVDYAAASGLPVAIFGSSMGGAVAIWAASRDERIGAVITDCAYASLPGLADNWWRNAFGPAIGLFCRPVKYLAAWIAKVPLSRAMPMSAIACIAPRPVFLTHGDQDTIVPVWHAHRLYESAREPKSLWLAPGCQHVQARVDRPELFYEQAVRFLKDWAESSVPERSV